MQSCIGRHPIYRTVIVLDPELCQNDIYLAVLFISIDPSWSQLLIMLWLPFALVITSDFYLHHIAVADQDPASLYEKSSNDINQQLSDCESNSN